MKFVILFIIKLLAISVMAQNNNLISFGGLEWNIRSADKLQGPGGNLFGQSPKNVRKNKKGQLCLKIIKSGNNYSCAEVFTNKYVGEGKIETVVQVKLKRFSEDMVLGIFLYDGTLPPHFNEVDIEYGFWGNKKKDNAQYAIHSLKGIDIHRFNLPNSKVEVKHIFDIKKEEIVIKSFLINSKGGNESLITTKTFVRPNEFTFSKTHFRFNLWLTKEKTSKKGRYPKVEVTSFKYLPLIKE